MALKKKENKTEKPEAQKEETGETSTEPTKEELAQTETKAPKKETKAPETKAETKAVAKKTTAAPPAELGDAAPAISSLEGAMDPIEFGGAFDRITPTSGAVTCDGTEFGKFIDVQVMSTSDRWMIIPDVDKDDEDDVRKYIRASYDGKNILHDEEEIPIDDYKDWVIDDSDGLVEKFKPLAKYRDIYCMPFNADDNAEDLIKKLIVQISVSQTAIKPLKTFTMLTKISVMKGLMLASHQNCMRITANSKKNKSKQSYTVFGFENVPLDVAAEYTPIIE